LEGSAKKSTENIFTASSQLLEESVYMYIISIIV